MTNEMVQSLEHYLPQLIRLAEKNISERFRGKIEAEDVAASVCRTFIRHYGDSEFRIENDAELWQLLVTITLNKTRNKARHFTAEKRDVGRETGASDSGLIAAMRSEPGPDEAVEFVDTLSILNERLDDEIAIGVMLRLFDGQKIVDIANELGVTTKTVQRKKARIREELAALM